MINQEKSIIITGATSGLGRALALVYAQPGSKLFLYGRNEARAKEIVALCNQKGAIANYIIADVTDSQIMQQTLQEICEQNHVDLLIANAGISGGTALNNDRTIMEVNVNGVLNTILPVLPYMQRQLAGQIVIISSLASYIALPSCPAYSASKAAVRFYGEAMRPLLAEYGIGITVVTPGYIKTPLTDVNNFPMPFLMQPEQAAAIIRERLRSNPIRITFPYPFYLSIILLSLLPIRVVNYLVSKLPKK
jgi:short-subunit dehydrogenase